MLFTDPIQADVQQQVNAKVLLLSKIVWPALATLVPAVVSAALKWTGDHSRKRRSAELTERISTLAKSVAELPELAATAGSSAATPHSVLRAELDAAVLELTAIQTRVGRKFIGVQTTTAKVRAALLLYWPRGVKAWLLHVSFYAYSFFTFFCLIAVMSSDSTAIISGTSGAEIAGGIIAYVLIFAVLGVPPLIIRHFASKIHRRQCAEEQAAAGAAAGPAAAAVHAAG